MSFADTVNRVMLLRSNVRDINTFRLIIKDEDYNEEQQLDTWIRNGIARNVQALDIHLGHQDRLGLPPCLFTCKTLVDLRLNSCYCVPDAVFLPNLKKLHLHDFIYGYDEKFQNLISGCPVLEELNIQALVYYDLTCCIISSPTIKWLTLIFELDEEDHGFGDYKLEINTPALRYLDVKDNASQVISTGIFNSLVESNICVNNPKVKDNFLYSSSVLEFVEKARQVKRLELSSGYRQFLDSSFAAITSKFINLTDLELAADWLFMLKFLESADNLQVLIIWKVEDDLKCWTDPQQVPTCLSSHLKQVTIYSFGGSEDEFKMVSYILKHGKVLNTMEIFSTANMNMMNTHRRYPIFGFEAKFNALQRISAFERQSETCKLQFS
ncbi:hypothetical protein BUALT_Bualt16G0004400 [Buddleja alternifolia]|uniref:FBD domain-containing protein n=1 Tax=Buddleja alternifolia TaxID=168488 RepID=A0AAV6WIJ3_9LAMI|nr:hypothetical protein BUALT_Bualt16G0004400 [Buddleja alternifolia]